jgi:hypothetical protein
MKRYAVLLCLSYLVATVATPARAELDWTKPDTTPQVQTDSVGGNGGSTFMQTCPPRTWLRGFETRDGDWIDAIALECAAPEESDGVLILGKPFGAGVMYGGDGGSPDGQLCDNPKEGVGGVKLVEGSNHYVSYIGLMCRSLTDLFSRHEGGSMGYTWRRQEIDIECPGGMMAYGIYGRYGVYLDRLGLLCAPPPSVKSPAPPPAPRHHPETLPPGGVIGHIDVRPKCKSNFFWRLAGPNDYVCVEIQSRAQAVLENNAAASRVDPNGAWGPKSCISGYVWREAFDGDLVCVTSQRRDAVREENRLGPSRQQ